MAKKHLNAAILKSNLSKLRFFFRFLKTCFGWKLTPKSQQNFTFNKVTNVPLKSISQYILTTWDALEWVDFYGKKASECHNFEVKFKQTSVFLDFSKFLLDGN